MGILFFLLFWIVIAIVGGIVADRKRRAGFGWFLLTLIFPLAILILFALPPRPAPAATE